VRHVAHTGEISTKSLKRRGIFEDLGVGGKMILKRILGKQSGKVWNGCIWLRIGTTGRLCEHSNEPLGSIKGGEFLD